MNKPSTRIKVLKPQTLTNIQINQITGIYLRHHHISEEDCQKRIKTGFDKIVVLQKKDDDEIVGFFGVRMKFFMPQPFGRPVLALYMGQLYIEKIYRSHQPVHEGVVRILAKYKLCCPWLKIVIWGDALTFKPYLLIAQNFPEFYPHPDKQTPDSFQQIFDYLGKVNYGSQYDEETGCVTKTSKLMKDHVAPIPPRLLRHKYIGFYASKNKDYKKGHGILVMGHFSFKAFINIAKKAYQQKKSAQGGSVFSLQFQKTKKVLSQQKAG